MKSSKKEQPEKPSCHDKPLSDEELGNVTGGTQDQIAEQQVNIGDLPNVRVDITPM
jgi:hypothetical protein